MKSGKILKDYLYHYYALLQRLFPCDEVLAKRILKSTVHATVSLILCLIPKVRNRLGTDPSMLPLIAVMVHPGRRVSGTIQGTIYCITGLITGLAFSLLARFIAQRCLGSTWDTLDETQQFTLHYGRYRAALAVLAVFEVILLFFHGWMRSVSHHYFGMVFPLFLVIHFSFLSPLNTTAGTIAHSFSTPFYLGIAMALFWNLALFPEFGSTYLGSATIDALNEIHHTINNAINFFVSIDEESKKLYASETIPSGRLLKMKDNISKKVNTCNAVMDECTYEISYSYMSPTELKPITARFKDLAVYVTAVINACQLEFMLLGHKYGQSDLLNLQTEREIHHADAAKLTKVLLKVRTHIFDLHKTLSDCFYLVKIILAKDFDVPIDKVRIPQAFNVNDFPLAGLKEGIYDHTVIDSYLNQLIKSLVQFDLSFRKELSSVDTSLLEPNDEMFLLASFLMNFKEITNTMIAMMKSTQDAHNKRVRRELRGWLKGKKVWLPVFHKDFSFLSWIYGPQRRVQRGTENDTLNGGNSLRYNPETVPMRPDNEEQEILSQQASRYISLQGADRSSSLLPTSTHDDVLEKENTSERNLRNLLTYVNRTVKQCIISTHQFFIRSKNHFRFGAQVSVALMLSSFPMFVPEARHWYINIHGAWIGFVCILCLEPSVGGTFWVFFLRGVGVIIGAAWGYLSYVAGMNQKNPYLEVIVTVFGAIPGFYVLLGTPYIKAAIIQIISIYIVLLAAVIPGSVGGSILQNFGKRCLAVGYGGGIALIVQVTLFPITARGQLNSEIAFATGCLAEMQMLYAAGIEGETLKLSLSDEKYDRFKILSEATKAALTRATAYKGLTRQEPRLKGKYAELESVFTQIIFILKQVVERFDNSVLLRRQYGSAIAEQLNSIVYPYRRQFVASMVNIMRAVQEAIINKTPLPQYLPSARIAHRRLINKVRKTLKQRYAIHLKTGKEHSDLRQEFQRDAITSSSNSQHEETDESDEDLGLVLKPSLNVNSRERNFILKEKFLSWSASSSAIEEIIEYIEELVQLTKILVGVNEFKYGFLSRPLFEDWAAEAVVGFESFLQHTHVNKPPPTNGTELGEEVTERPNPEGMDEDFTDSDSEMEYNQPVSLPTDDHVLKTLARMATRTSSSSDRRKSSKWHRRTYSIGSGMGDDTVNKLARVHTLGEASGSLYDNERSSDEEDLPLVLKRIISHKK